MSPENKAHTTKYFCSLRPQKIVTVLHIELTVHEILCGSVIQFNKLREFSNGSATTTTALDADTGRHC